ncbi:hypothetical protein BH10PSE2_BH10PSE2_07030 [soil metagenome]
MTPFDRFCLIATGAAAMALASAPVMAQTVPAAPQARVEPVTGGAAGTLPNTFDGPATSPRMAAAAVPSEVPPAGDPAVVARAETALKTTISALQGGAPNYADMSPALADKVRPQAVNITPLIQGFGTLQSVVYVGQEEQAQLFLVIFEKQATQWIIAQGDDGKIVALLFRPAPAAPTAAPTPPAT